MQIQGVRITINDHDSATSKLGDFLQDTFILSLRAIGVAYGNGASRPQFSMLKTLQELENNVFRQNSPVRMVMMEPSCSSLQQRQVSAALGYELRKHAHDPSRDVQPVHHCLIERHKTVSVALGFCSALAYLQSSQ